MRAPAPIERADYLVVESTYGDRRHDPADPRIKLGEVVRRTAAQGGAVIIPAFAVGRAQALLYYLMLLKREGAIPSTLPMFLNSPMAADVTDLYHRFRDQHRLDPGECAAMCKTATIVNTAEPVRAEVLALDSLSAHADYTEIVEWLAPTRIAPTRTFVTHGEPAAADALRGHVEAQLGWPCSVPDYLESVELA